MTMPSERTRALICAVEFLQELRCGIDTPDAIRAEAISVLRHFPAANSIELEAERQLRRHQEVTKEAWLLPVDHYEWSKSTLQTCRENPELPPRLIHDIVQADIPMTGLSAYIANLAQQHGVAYVKTGSSALAEVITALSDDDVKPDETEKLVIALRRANVINGQIMVTLLGRYFDETRN